MTTLDRVVVPPEPPSSTAGYRYPGSPPFQDTALDRELFRGRDREADVVLHSILSSNLLVLYSVSGLGKTSLLNAGVMHRLRERGHWPVSVRLNDPSTTIVEAIRRQIEAAARADPSVELLHDPAAAPDAAASNLWDVLASLEIWRRNDLQQPVVVLDQFEELFTLGWQQADRTQFIAQLGEVLRGFRMDAPTGDGPDEALPPPRVKFVVVIREDSLGELEALSRDVPQIMDNRFRLEPLRPDQAEAAIREPAMLEDTRLGSRRFRYTEAAAALILEFLRTRTVRGTVVHSDVVDPSQLQIVCQYVERTILPRKPAGDGAPIEVDDTDLEGRDGLERVLRHFYQRTLQTFPPARQRAIRELCETGLINKSRRRLSLEEEEIGRTFHVTPDELKHLVDERLLRADPRLDSVYYELAHDTLIEPILDHRADMRDLDARRRRRWIVGVIGAVVVVAAATLAVLVARWVSADEEDHAQLAIGEELDGVVAADDGTPFELAVPAGRMAVVTVTPEERDVDEIDLAIELTNAGGTTQFEDRAAAGEIERVVVSATGDEDATLRVSSLNSTTGPFTITAEHIDVSELAPGATTNGRIDGPGDIAVFRLDARASTPVVVDVSPLGIGAFYYGAGGMPYYGSGTTSESDGAEEDPSQKGSKTPVDLDVDIDVIDERGVVTQVDASGAARPERFTVPADGSTILVAHGFQESVGDFVVDVSAATTLVPGRPERLDIGLEHPVHVAFDAPDAGPYLARVTSGLGVAGGMEVLRPNGVLVPIEPVGPSGEQIAILAGLQGPYILTVYGSAAGESEIQVDSIRAEPLTVGSWRAAKAGDVLELDVDQAPVAVLIDARDGSDPVLQVADPRGSMRSIDSHGQDSMETTTLTATGRHMIRVSDFEGGDADIDVIALPAAEQHLTTDGDVTSTLPAVFDVDVEDGDPLLVSARATSGGSPLEVQVIGPDGYTIGTGVDGQAASSTGPAVATVGGGQPGTYHVVVSSADHEGAIEASLSPITALGAGEAITDVSPMVLLVDVGANETKVVNAAGAGVVTVEVASVEGFAVAPNDGIPLASKPGEPLAVTVGQFGEGTYRVSIRAAEPGAEVTATLDTLDELELTPGETAPAGGPSGVFEVEIGAAGPQLFTAAGSSPSSPLQLEIVGPYSMPFSSDAAALEGAEELPAELPPDVVALFPAAVVELFADGLPATVGEAAAMLEEAGLLDEVELVLSEHPEVQAALFGTPAAPPPGGPVTAVLGGMGPGVYRVVVTSSDPANEVTGTLAPVEVHPLDRGTSTTAAAPAVFEIAMGTRAAVFTATPGAADVRLGVSVLAPYGEALDGVAAPSVAPGAPATAIVGGGYGGPGTYKIIVTTSQPGATFVARAD